MVSWQDAVEEAWCRPWSRSPSATRTSQEGVPAPSIWLKDGTRSTSVCVLAYARQTTTPLGCTFAKSSLGHPRMGLKKCPCCPTCFTTLKEKRKNCFAQVGRGQEEVKVACGWASHQKTKVSHCRTQRRVPRSVVAPLPMQRSCKGSDQRAQRVLKKSDAHNDECTHSTFSHRSAHAPSDGSGHRLWHRPLKGAPLPDEPNAWRYTVCIVEYKGICCTFL